MTLVLHHLGMGQFSRQTGGSLHKSLVRVGWGSHGWQIRMCVLKAQRQDLS